MRRATITAAEFNSLRRQLPPGKLGLLVKRIEREYRKALGVTTLTRDAIVRATVNTRGQTADRVSGLRVIRFCIAYRESLADVRALRANPGVERIQLDHLSLAIADADPVRLVGAASLKRNATGGTKTADRRKRDAERRDARIRSEAQKLRARNPAMSVREIARRLSERNGLGGAEAIRKKLAILLRS